MLFSFINKKKHNLLDLFFNFFLVITLIFSANFLEEDLIIGVFSTSILFVLFFFIKDLVFENIRQYRRRVKKIFRVQRDFLKRNYFIHNKIARLHFLYMKKIIFHYYFIKCLKLFINFNLKIKYFLSKVVYFKIYYLNLITSFIFKLSFKLLNLFYFYI